LPRSWKWSPAPIRATCPTSPILFYLITRMTYGDEYRSLSSSLCSVLHSPVTPSLLDPISAPYSQTPSAYVPSSILETKFHAHTKQQANS
jgi:hypothetical protein